MTPRRHEPGTAQRQQLERQANAWANEGLSRGLVQEDAPIHPEVWPELVVEAVHKEYLVCHFFDGVTGYLNPFNVAMPASLRPSSWDGLTIAGIEYKTLVGMPATRSAGGRFEIAHPPYLLPEAGQGEDPDFPGSIISAIPMPLTVKDDAGEPLYCQWREIGTRAYHWLPVLMKITSASLDTDNRWLYALSEIKYLGRFNYADVTNPRAGTGTNLAETNNSASGVQSNGINVDNLPQGVALQPLPVGRPVLAWPVVDCNTLTVEYIFDGQNLPDGLCEGGSS